VKVTAAALLAAVACCSSWATPSVEGEPSVVPAEADRAADPPASPSQFQGRSAEWRAHRATHWKRRVLKHRRANRQRLQLGASGVARGLLCIHSFEGSWTDGGAPFWGGLQMDAGFQRTYAPELVNALGTADNWPPFLQVAVAMRAYYSGRGFGPWPNTRRMCGV